MVSRITKLSVIFLLLLFSVAVVSAGDLILSDFNFGGGSGLSGETVAYGKVFEVNKDIEWRPITGVALVNNTFPERTYFEYRVSISEINYVLNVVEPSWYKRWFSYVMSLVGFNDEPWNTWVEASSSSQISLGEELPKNVRFMKFLTGSEPLTERDFYDAGNYTVIVTIDPLNKIVEDDESNNELSMTLQVLPLPSPVQEYTKERGDYNLKTWEKILELKPEKTSDGLNTLSIEDLNKFLVICNELSLRELSVQCYNQFIMYSDRAGLNESEYCDKVPVSIHKDVDDYLNYVLRTSGYAKELVEHVRNLCGVYE